MASILMGVITAILIILICGVVFYVGYKVGYENQPTPMIQEETPRNEPTKRQSEISEGMSNILNYANRHGGKK